MNNEEQPAALTLEEYRLRDTRTGEKWEPLIYTNATPDEGYVLRILKAHLHNCESGKWYSSDVDNQLVKHMNDWQDQRAELLRKAIAELSKKEETQNKEA